MKIFKKANEEAQALNAHQKVIWDAAILSPTGNDIQDIDLLVVTNNQKIDEISKITLNTIEENSRNKLIKRIHNFNIQNPITGDAGCLICLIKNERSSSEPTPIHEGIIEMSLMIAAREFGLQSMVLGCMKHTDRESIEKVLGIEPGHFIVGVVIGKPIEKPFFIPKKIKAKVSYIK